jgi:hypothetical protein
LKNAIAKRVDIEDDELKTHDVSKVFVPSTANLLYIRYLKLLRIMNMCGKETVKNRVKSSIESNLVTVILVEMVGIQLVLTAMILEVGNLTNRNYWEPGH